MAKFCRGRLGQTTPFLGTRSWFFFFNSALPKKFSMKTLLSDSTLKIYHQREKKKSDSQHPGQNQRLRGLKIKSSTWFALEKLGALDLSGAGLSPSGCLDDFFEGNWSSRGYAATELALQLHQECTHVVCSNREARKRPARRHRTKGKSVAGLPSILSQN